MKPHSYKVQHKVFSRVGVSTEANFPVLKTRKTGPQVPAQIQTRNLNFRTTKSPKQPKQHFDMFFDNQECKDKIIKTQKALLDQPTSKAVDDGLQQRRVKSAKPASEVTAKQIKRAKDERYSYCADLKKDIPSVDHYRVNYCQIQRRQPNCVISSPRREKPTEPETSE